MPVLPPIALALAPAPGIAGPQRQPPATVARLPACTASQLSLAFDGEGGAFDGMSHSGALLVVRNIGPAACRFEGLPAIAFLDAGGMALDVARQAPPGMHPGPVVLLVGIAPGAEATAPLRWISGDVWGGAGGGGRCRAVRSARIHVGGQTIGTALSATICSPAGQPARFDQPVLRVDPLL